MHKLKEKYYNKCTLLGIIGQPIKFLLLFYWPFSLCCLLGAILLFSKIGALFSVLGAVMLIFLYAFSILMLRRYRIEKIFNIKVKLIKKTDDKLDKKLEEIFNEFAKEKKLQKIVRKIKKD